MKREYLGYTGFFIGLNTFWMILFEKIIKYQEKQNLQFNNNNNIKIIILKFIIIIKNYKF